VRRTPVRSASPAPQRLRVELQQLLRRVAREIDRGLQRAPLSPEAIHDLHRDLRRLAILLSVWERLVPTERSAAVDELSQRLRRLARLVGRVRDRDVTASLLAPSARGQDPGWGEFLGRLREDRDAGRELLRAFLTSERQAGLFDRLAETLEVEPKAGAGRSLERILTEVRHRRQGRVDRARRKARRDPSAERLHRLRIRIRRWRHLAALEAAVGLRRAPNPSPSWQRLQGRLGQLHDLDVALATVPEELGAASAAQRLTERRRRVRLRVRRSLERIGPLPRPAPTPPKRRGRR